MIEADNLSVQLSAIAGAAPTALSTFAIADSQTIVFMDEIGLRLITADLASEAAHYIGKPGGGPGEFANPSAIALKANGGTIVHDFGRKGFIILDSAGTELGFQVSDINVMGPIAEFGEGLLVVDRRIRGNRQIDYLVSLVGDRTGSIDSASSPLASDIRLHACNLSLNSLPLAPDPIAWATDGRVLLQTQGSEYEIIERDSTGSIRAIYRRSFPAFHWSAERHDAEFGDTLRIGVGPRSCAVAWEDILPSSRFRSTTSPIQRILIQNSDTFLVVRRDAAMIDLFSRRAGYLGTFPYAGGIPGGLMGRNLLSTRQSADGLLQLWSHRVERN